MGLWQPSAARALRLRHDLGRDDLKLMFNVNAELPRRWEPVPLRRGPEALSFHRSPTPFSSRVQ